MCSQITNLLYGMTDFSALFQSLAEDTNSHGAIPVRRAPKMPHVWIGKDDTALPVLIVETTLDGPIPSVVVLRNLRFDPRLACLIDEKPYGERRSVQASVIRITTFDPELHAYFFRTVSALFTELGPRPRVSELARAIDRLAEMFRALALPPTTSLQGLWAELLMIRQAPSTEYAVRAWHATRRSLFDFDGGGHAVEIKSSTSGIRKHHFRLAQLQPRPGHDVYVVSVLLKPSQSGSSIPDLWKNIDAKLTASPQLSSRLAEVIAQSAGVDWQHAKDVRFDDVSALRSILIFKAESIPRVGDSAGPEVTEIEFVSDLSACVPLGSATLEDDDGLVSALFRDRVNPRHA